MKWHPMKTAPKDGTLILLLVDSGGEGAVGNATEDDRYYRTIGSNIVTGQEPPTWSWAGWDWDQDSYCSHLYNETKHKLVAWAPIPEIPKELKPS